MHFWSIVRSIDWLIYLFHQWSIDWLTDWSLWFDLIDWLIDLIWFDRLIDRLIDWFFSVSAKAGFNVPSFSGHSYAALATPQNVLMKLDVDVTFVARSDSDGIILYIGASDYGSDRDDFFSLAVKNKGLELRFDLGSGTMVILHLADKLWCLDKFDVWDVFDVLVRSGAAPYQHGHSGRRFLPGANYPKRTARHHDRQQ